MSKSSLASYRLPVRLIYLPLIATFVLLQALSSFAQTDSIWLGGSGAWNDAANWSGGIPDGDFNALIDNANTTNSIVDINAAEDFSVAGLTLDSDDTLRLFDSTLRVFDTADVTIEGDLLVNNNSILYLSGTINNVGDGIVVDSTGNYTNIVVDNVITILTGGGTLTLSNLGCRIIDVNAFDGRLVNGKHTIQGAGNIGLNSLQLINTANGVIEANVFGQSLYVNPSTLTGMVNAGTMRSTGGGDLTLAGAIANSVDGVIEAHEGSKIRLLTGYLIGGRLQTSGDGRIEVPFTRSFTLDSLTINGNLVVESAANLYLDGIINNQGSLSLASLGTTATLQVRGTVATLTGGGTLTLGGSTSSNSRIQDNLNESGTLRNLDNSIQGKGRLGDGTLEIENLLNGVIDADDAEGTMTIDSRDTFVNDGNTRASGGGRLVMLGSADYTNNGTFEVQNDSTFDLASVNLTNFPSFKGTLSGGRWIARSTSGSSVMSLPGIGITEIGSGTTIRLQGANSVIQSGSQDISDSIALNNGHLDLIDYTMSAPNFDRNNGRVSLDQDSVLDVGGNSIENSGMLEGDGDVIANVLLNSGIISPGFSVGSIEIFGDLTMEAASTVEIELDEPIPTVYEFDRLLVSHDTILNGSLNVGLLDNLELTADQEFVIIEVGGNSSGEFDQLAEGALVAASGNYRLNITYLGGDGNDVALYTEPTILADNVTVIEGSINSGGLPELLDSDDQYLVLNPVFLSFRYQLQFTVDATSTTSTPSALEFSYESRTFSFVGSVEQKIELFNYVTGQFEAVDTRLTTPVDTVVSVTPGGDPARFVQAGTDAMQARISYQNSLRFWVFSTQNLYLPYRVRVDHIFWTITP